MCLKKYRIAFQAGGQKHIDRYFYIARATVLQNQNSFNVLRSLENRDLHNTCIPHAVRHTVLCKSFWPPTKWRYSLSIKKYEGNRYYTKLVVSISFNFCPRQVMSYVVIIFGELKTLLIIYRNISEKVCLTLEKS